MSDVAPQTRRERMRQRIEPRRQALEARVKAFEWTWTNAVLFSLALTFFIWITMAVIPSFWMYFAEQTLGWDGQSGDGRWQPLARDAVAMGLATGPLITIVVAAAIMQNWRHKLRGQTDSRPTGGYR
jgi:Na+/melibiose symporter-like transporter